MFESSGIDADAALLRERGVAVPDRTEDMPWARVLRFTDPDGNGLALQTSPPRV